MMSQLQGFRLLYAVPMASAYGSSAVEDRKSGLLGGVEKSKIPANQPTGGDLRPIFAGFLKGCADAGGGTQLSLVTQDGFENGNVAARRSFGSRATMCEPRS